MDDRTCVTVSLLSPMLLCCCAVDHAAGSAAIAGKCTTFGLWVCLIILRICRSSERILQTESFTAITVLSELAGESLPVIGKFCTADFTVGAANPSAQCVRPSDISLFGLISVWARFA
jgi:hypothetical protein